MNIIGRLTGNAQVSALKDNRQVVNFSVAVNDGYKSKQGTWVDVTEFFDCSYWISPNIAPYLTKGRLVELSGRASASAWAGNDGQIRARMNFHASQIKFHDRVKGATPTAEQSAQAKTPIAQRQDFTEDDLPF